ncbi:niemann-Pick type C- protein 1 [Sorochytrium milnesiophthora]
MATQEGTCVMYGQCGQRSLFSPPLNCAGKFDAVQPGKSHRSSLVQVCGSRFAAGKVCCDEDQLTTLDNSIKTASAFINPCPACWDNFLTFWCQFTCSPNQAAFANVTATEKLQNGATVATEVDFWVAPSFGDAFFKSCRDVKFGSDNRFAMEFVGGGATSYKDFFRFMGEPKPEIGGSPFRIDFPDSVPGAVSPLDVAAVPCNSTAALSRCSCFDCADACPALPNVSPLHPGARQSTLYGFGHLTVAALLVYGVIMLAAISFLMYKVITSASLWNICFGYAAVPTDEDTPSRSQAPHGVIPVPATRQQDEQQKIRRYWLLQRIERVFYVVGQTSARYPVSVIAFCILLIGVSVLSASQNLQFATDPVDLWVGPSSTALAEKQYFDEHFGPFYRITQLFFSAGDDGLMKQDHIRTLFDVQSAIRNLHTAPCNVSLSDLCFQPLAHDPAALTPGSSSSGCVVQSVTGYWQDSWDTFNQQDDATWRKHLSSCTANPSQFQCLPTFQQPLRPNIVLGGSKSGRNSSADHNLTAEHDWLDSRAFVVTFVNQNSLNKTWLARSAEWEHAVADLLASIRDDKHPSIRLGDLRLSYSTEASCFRSSIETELRRSTSADIPTIVASYLAMFVYVTLALGRGTKIWSVIGRPSLWRDYVVHSKATLGLVGIVVVLSSLVISAGLLSALGVRATYIVAEVIPFLILAIGVDNIFIIVNEFERHATIPGQTIVLPVPQRAARTLARVGPGILLSALAEAVAFLVGAVIPMPAVSSFCLYSAVAVLANTLLQATAFVAFLALDAERSRHRRADCLPCLSVRPSPADATAGRELAPTVLETAFRAYGAKLTAPLARRVVLAMTLLTTVLALISMSEIKLGLDQREALPRQSYLVSYFDDMDKYLEVGPPLYFVTKDVDFVNRTGQRPLCARLPECKNTSVPTLIEQERKRPNVSYFAEPPASWLDDFFFWLQPTDPDDYTIASPPCCSYRSDDPLAFCDDMDDPAQCTACVPYGQWKISNMSAMPEGDQFVRYLEHWRQSPPSISCPLAGSAAYANAVALGHRRNNDSQPTDGSASHFRTYYVPLKTQSDYIDAQRSSQRVAQELSEQSGVEVFAYSVFHVFFEQYQYIVSMAWQTVLLSIVGVWLVALAVLGSLRESLLMAACLALMATWLAGFGLGLARVSLNAVSVVNIVMGVGLSVEFCSHLIKSYLFQRGSQALRAHKALVDVGPSILTGIGLTKVVGVSVLAFAKSILFRQYYFKIYVGIVLIALAVGLVVLPVMLSIAGGDAPLSRGGGGGDGGTAQETDDLAGIDQPSQIFDHLMPDLDAAEDPNETVLDEEYIDDGNGDEDEERDAEEAIVRSVR